MNNIVKPKVVIVQPLTAHYRKSFFEQLSNTAPFNFSFIAGDKYLNIKSVLFKNCLYLPFRSFGMGNHKFYYLKGCMQAIRKTKPDIIVLGGLDFHLLHTLQIFLINLIVRRWKIVWWTQATFGQQGWMGDKLRLFFYLRARGLMTYSLKGKEALIRRGISAAKIEVLGNSICKEDYGFLKHNLANRVPSDTFTLLFSGRINTHRRLDLLIWAVSRLNTTYKIKVHCIIVGQGERGELASLVSTLQLGDVVHFVGAKYGADAAKYFLQSDLMVYPKAIGLSILHAYSFGIPVITTNNMKIQMPEIELLDPGNTGDFYKDEDVEDLTLVLQKWFLKLHKERAAVHKNCIHQIKKYGYLPDEMAARFVSTLQKFAK